MKVTIYTDGSARGNPDGPGGYGVVIIYIDPKGGRHVKEISEGFEKTTNNRMELMGVIAGLEALNRPCERKACPQHRPLAEAPHYGKAAQDRLALGQRSRRTL